jgi:hypothetical protein
MTARTLAIIIIPFVILELSIFFASTQVVGCCLQLNAEKDYLARI